MDWHTNENYQVGETNSLTDILDGVPYNLFAMKDVDYNMKLMNTYGNLVANEGNPLKHRRWKTRDDGSQQILFHSHEPFANHYMVHNAI